MMSVWRGICCLMIDGGVWRGRGRGEGRGEGKGEGCVDRVRRCRGRTHSGIKFALRFDPEVNWVEWYT